MRDYTKFHISLPNDLVEVLDSFAEYEGFTRSGAVAYLLASGLCQHVQRTNDFDFNNVFDIYEDDRKKIVLKRKDVNLDKQNYSWEFSLGKNKKISDKDFVQNEIKKGDVQE